MATAADIDTDLTLELDGSEITPEKFQKSVRAFFGVVDEVTRSVCEGRPAVKWRVQVKRASNLIGVAPVPGFPLEVIGTIAIAVQEGIAALEREDVRPKHFSDAAIRYARNLGVVIGTDPRDDTRIRLWARKHALVVSHHTVANAAALLTGQFEDHGSIDGRLQTVSERGAIRIVVYETLGDRGVPCFIDAAQLPEAISSFGKRVEVYGIVRYRNDGTAVSIKVEEIVPFPPPDEIPDFRSVRGILRSEP